MKRYKSIQEPLDLKINTSGSTAGSINNPLRVDTMKGPKGDRRFEIDPHSTGVKEILSEPNITKRFKLIQHKAFALGYKAQSADEKTFVAGLARMMKSIGNGVPVRASFVDEYYKTIYGE
jgi:hypothetical protein